MRISNKRTLNRNAYLYISTFIKSGAKSVVPVFIKQGLGIFLEKGEFCSAFSKSVKVEIII